MFYLHTFFAMLFLPSLKMRTRNLRFSVFVAFFFKLFFGFIEIINNYKLKGQILFLHRLASAKKQHNLYTLHNILSKDF